MHQLQIKAGLERSDETVCYLCQRPASVGSVVKPLQMQRMMTMGRRKTRGHWLSGLIVPARPVMSCVVVRILKNCLYHCGFSVRILKNYFQKRALAINSVRIYNNSSVNKNHANDKSIRAKFLNASKSTLSEARAICMS